MTVKSSLVRFVIAFAAGLALNLGAATVTYNGADGGDWDTASNWSPEQVPTSADDVTIANGKWVRSAGSIAVNSLTITSGSLAVGGTSKTFDAQIADRTSTDEITLTIAGDLVLNGAVNLSVGGRAANLGLGTGFDATRFHVQNVEVSIGGDFFTPLGAVIGLFFFVV